jgi:acyl-CoA reductase-like NAD-dependent aldehyde dehydrogenase
MKLTNPFTGEELDRPSTSSNDLKQSFNFQKENQKAWGDLPLEQRLSIIEKFSDELQKREEKLAKILTKEMGKPLQESRNEIRGAKSRIKFFLKNSEEYLKPRDCSKPGIMKEEIHFEPLGVIGNISAWNYPYLVGVNVFIPALICGNAVLYKPSEYTSLTGLEIQKIFYDCGLPSYAFQVAIGGQDVGRQLLELPLDGIFFTGSYKTGLSIQNQVSSKLIPVGLELGGKDPLYITDDLEDIDQVAQSALEGVFYNNGQSCCSVERIYIHEKIAKSFLEKFKEKAQKLKVGDPMAPGTTQGPLTRKEQISFLKNQVQEALSKGAEVIFEGEIPQGPGYFFPPTILKNVDHTMGLMKEESFGPVIGVQVVSNDEEAIQLMNDTSYGLTSSVYAKDEKRGREILKQINSGTGYLNCCDRVSPYLPWSGRKNSGLGSTLSFLGIQAFCRPKALHIKS